MEREEEMEKEEDEQPSFQKILMGFDEDKTRRRSWTIGNNERTPRERILFPVTRLSVVLLGGLIYS